MDSVKELANWRLHSACARSVMVHGSETWPFKENDASRLDRNDERTVKRMRIVRPNDRLFAVELKNRLQLNTMRAYWQNRRLLWFGHQKRMNRENRVNAKSLRLVVVYLNERDLADLKVSKGLAKDRPDLERNDTFEFPWSSTFRKSENLTH